MVRPIYESERQLINANGMKCDTLGCDREIELVEIGGATANLPSYYCCDHAEQRGARSVAWPG